MGDMHGAALVRAVIEAAGEENVEVYAMGGKRMKDAGAILIGGWCVNPLPTFSVYKKQENCAFISDVHFAVSPLPPV